MKFHMALAGFVSFVCQLQAATEVGSDVSSPTAHKQSTDCAMETGCGAPDQVPFRATTRALALDGGDATGEMDTFLPLWQTTSHLVFADVRVAESDLFDLNFSGGIGYRALLSHPDVILGANVFFDSTEPNGLSRFSQIGVGIEALSRRFDFRANGYFPVAGAKRAGSTSVSSVTHGDGLTIRDTFAVDFTENPNVAMDAEIGVLVPWVDRFTDLRIFGGSYFIDSDYGDNANGWFCRGEWQPVRGIVFEGGYSAAFENSDQGAWYGGIRVNFEFGGPKPSKSLGPISLDHTTALSVRRDEYVRRNSVISVETKATVDPASRRIVITTGRGQTITARGSEANQLAGGSPTLTVTSDSSQGSSGSSSSGGTLVTNGSYSSGGSSMEMVVMDFSSISVIGPNSQITGIPNFQSGLSGDSGTVILDPGTTPGNTTTSNP